MSDYYAFHQIPILLQGKPATMIGKQGVWNWDDVNPGTTALLDTMEVHVADRVLDLGCGTGVIGLAAARLADQGYVMLIDVNVAAVECSRRTLQANGVTNAQVHLSDGIDVVEEYDLILSHLPRGRAVIQALIRDAAIALKPGGRFYFVAHKRAGIKGAIDYVKQTLGQAVTVCQKAGYHVALAEKRQPLAAKVSQKASDNLHIFDITLDGVPTKLASRPGVFAWDRLDEGTAALAGSMDVLPGESVLDLGCGAGLLALAAARRGGRVTAVDADLRAIDSARRTLAANGAEGEVLISDWAHAVLDRRFDVVLCNPPFHQGTGVEYDVARQMVRDAATVLRSGGRFCLVSNAFLRYEREMKDRFAVVEEVFNDRRYRVLRAMR